MRTSMMSDLHADKPDSMPAIQSQYTLTLFDFDITPFRGRAPFVVAAEFDVLEAGAVAEGVVGDVEDVVGLVVGQVDLQEVEPLVDGPGQAEAVGEHVD